MPGKKSFSLVFILLCLVVVPACTALNAAEDNRPNFLIIVTDDQRFDTMEYMPRTQELIFDQGVTFTHAYVTTPLCCPSRASILTGMYAHNHQVYDNDGELTTSTVIDDLHGNGYYTGLIGKYLNTWKGEARPEYDYWVSFARGESRYNNPLLNVNGEWIRHQDQYITYALGDYAIKFIEAASRKNQPFALMFTPNAPHQPAVPADEDKYAPIELPLYRPPSFNEEDMSDKPIWLSDELPLNDEQIAELDTFRRAQILTLFGLDRTIDRIIAELSDVGELDNTMIIFLSDNGKQWGEHRMTSKNSYYEESSHVPFGLRYPPLVPQPYIEEKVVGNIDIAPTMYELAGLPIPSRVDGASLVGLLQGGEWREGILIEGWPGRGIYAAIHTGRYVYAETEGDVSEFYDLETDPYQLENSINDTSYQTIIAELKLKLAELK